MTMLEQSYTINARRVVVNTFPAAERVDRARAHEVANDESSVASALQHLDATVELEDGAHEHADDLVVHVAAAAERPVDVVDGARLVDDLDDSLRQIHDSSPSFDAPAVATPVAHRSNVGEDGAPSTSPVGAPRRTRSAATPAVGLVRPYYEDALVTLYNADCLDHIALWCDGDVLITDPPYGLEGLAGAYGTKHRVIANDQDTKVRDRVLAIWGEKPAAVFGSPRLPEPPGGWSDRLVWDKGQLGLNGGAWRYAHESIFVRGEGWVRESDKASSILRHTSQSNRAHVADHIHSKPMPLLEQIILSAPAGLLIEPFAGGGSTVVAASLLGRRIIAFELDPEHCATIVKRLGQQSFDLTALDMGPDGGNG
jgi:hypothetical protein